MDAAAVDEPVPVLVTGAAIASAGADEGSSGMWPVVVGTPASTAIATQATPART
jgi:hypothetical protein